MISKAAPFDGLFDGKCEWKKVFVYQYQYLRRSIDNRMGIIGLQVIMQAKIMKGPPLAFDFMAALLKGWLT